MRKKYCYLGVLAAAVIAAGGMPVSLSGKLVTGNGIVRAEAASLAELEDGEYTIEGEMRHATLDQPSMGNASVEKPFTIIKEGDELTLKLEFVSLKTGIFTGYLYKLYYFPDWTSDMVPYFGEPKELTVTDYYEGFYDYYNDPDTGTDLLARGNLYPHYMTMPVEWGKREIWVEVYVPVMEGISAGSGSQFAKLLLDWDTITKAESSSEVSNEDSGASGGEHVSDDTPADGSESGRPSDTDEESGGDTLSDSPEHQIQSGDKEKSSETQTDSPKDTEARNTEEISDDAEHSESSDAGETKQESQLDDTGSSDADDSRADTAKQSETSDTGEPRTDVSADSSGHSESSDTQKSTAAEESNGSKSTDSEETAAVPVSLDIKNLSDGIYSIYGEMKKIDKKTSSMSNDAINHNIKLTVENGIYYITMDFKGLTINQQKGYLGKLKYYLSGYQLDQYGSPTGDLREADVLSYQTDVTGNRVSDSFGTDYPELVTYELIPEALDDGWVPLQVFVPIMESIAAGTGTQPVFLKLDLSTVKQTSSDDAAFQPASEDTAENSDTGNDSKRNSITDSKSTLPTEEDSSSGKTSGTGSSSESTTKKTTDSKSSSGSTAKSTANTKLPSGSTGTNAGSTASSGKKSTSLPGNSSNGTGSSTRSDGQKTASGNDGSGMTDAADSVNTGSADASTARSRNAVAASQREAARNKKGMPAAASILSVIAGIGYKFKSRR